MDIFSDCKCSKRVSTITSRSLLESIDRQYTSSLAAESRTMGSDPVREFIKFLTASTRNLARAPIGECKRHTDSIKERSFSKSRGLFSNLVNSSDKYDSYF